MHNPWGESTKCQHHSSPWGVFLILCYVDVQTEDLWEPHLNWSGETFQPRRRLVVWLKDCYLFFSIPQNQSLLFFSPECPLFRQCNIKCFVAVWKFFWFSDSLIPMVDPVEVESATFACWHCCASVLSWVMQLLLHEEEREMSSKISFKGRNHVFD